MAEVLLVSADGQPLADEVMADLSRIEVEQRINDSSRLTMWIFDPEYRHLDGDLLRVGTKVEVAYGELDAGDPVTFIGSVTGLGVEHEADDLDVPRLVVRCHDRSYALGNRSVGVGYLNRSVGDVLSDIAESHGLKVVEKSANYAQFDHLLQASTDRELLDRLVVRGGLVWWVTGESLHVAARETAASMTLRRSDGTLVRFSASYDASALPATVEVHGWDADGQRSLEGSAKLTAADPGSDAPLVASAIKAATQAKPHTLHLGAQDVDDQQGVDAAARIHADRIARRGLQVSGVAFGDPRIVAGQPIRVEEVGTSLTGTYYLTRVVHEFAVGDQARTHFHCEPPVAVESAASSAGERRWNSQGPVLAKVTNVKDTDANLGRVKVTYPTLGSRAESGWARVLALGAGEETGLDLRPQVDDEVVVVFEDGDPNRPLVLGGLYSKARPSMLDSNQTDAVQEFEFRTPAGHRLAFDDDGATARWSTPDDKALVELTPDGITVEATDQMSLALKAGGASITLTDKGEIVIKGAGVTVDGGQDPVKVKGQTVDVEGFSGVKLAATAGDIEGTGMGVKFDATAMAEISGAMVKIN